ncbi:hypothetical protein ACRCPM_20735, partial [Pseudomonas aeruginosa]
MKNTIHINFAIFLIIANIIYSSASASTDISTVASPLFEGTEGCFLLYDGRRQKLSATPDLSGTVLPLCHIPNSALK